jgi:protein TonB
MYRPQLDAKHRSGALAAVAAIHAALLFAFLNLSGRIDLPGPQSAIQIFDIDQVEPPPPPPPPPQQQQRERQKPKETEGGAPANIRSQATPIVAPKPKVVVPPVPTVSASETPRQGAAPTQGAAAVSGPGTGAGGSGTGTGTGSGSGSGGGGDGGAVQPPRLVTPVLRGRDFPRDLLESWPRGAQIFLRLRVDSRGYVSECAIDRGSGVRTIDAEICNLAHQRLRFRPALNKAGQPVAGWFGYRQTAPR